MKIIFLSLLPIIILGQPSWKKDTPKQKPAIELFHSSQTANYPTAEILSKGNFMYEISHRFGQISGGYDQLYGLDGPVNMRTALSYGLANNLMITLGRSNVLDNLDLNAKVRLLSFDNDDFPSVFAVRAGIAVNTEPSGVKRDRFDSNNMQFYTQLVYNVMFFDKKLGIGLVPSFLYNSYIYANEYNNDPKTTITLGTYYQYYVNRMWSFWFEYSPVISGWQGALFFADSRRSYNALAYGIDMETGGHVFHLFVTNSTRLNPGHYLIGSDNKTNSNAWHFGFGITREL